MRWSPATIHVTTVSVTLIRPVAESRNSEYPLGIEYSMCWQRVTRFGSSLVRPLSLMETLKGSPKSDGDQDLIISLAGYRLFPPFSSYLGLDVHR
jgi:hypothetical protein